MVVSHKQNRHMGRTRANLEKGWIILALFAAVVALTGGASRFDATQIIPLRALSAVFLVSSLLFMTKEKVKAERTLVILFGCFTVIVAVQLVPLPSWVGQSLHERTEIGRIDAVLGLESLWRPLSLTPMRGWNVLGGLVVPAAGLLLAIAFRTSSTTLLRIIAGLGVLNALVGILQIATGKSSALYFYEVTNRGSPVGILANENHAAVFAACSMLVVALLGLKARQRFSSFWERLVYIVAFLFILFVSLVGGSRAGLIAAIGAISVSMVMLVLSPRQRRGRATGDAVRRWFDERPSLILVIPVIIVLLTAASFLALDRAPAFRDILARDNFEDLRWSLWPVITAMLEDHWLLGAGFGAFEQVFHIYEPSALLMPSYINQAHNDWAQLVIEGGAMAGGLAIGLFVWLAKMVDYIARHRALRVDALFWMTVFAIIAGASVIDYPMRTPLFQLVTIWLLLALSRGARGEKTA